MKIFCIGDIVGNSGMDAVKHKLKSIKTQNKIDFVIANGENTAGIGISAKHAEELFISGVDVITLGNHAFKQLDIISVFDQTKNILRPYNASPELPGDGYVIIGNICVINLIGQLNMNFKSSNPFWVIDKLITEVSKTAEIIIIDFHSEATSEKYALFNYLIRRVSAIFGTHTHVQTADEQIKDGTGYITDIGMTGDTDSVIGILPEQSIAFFKGNIGKKYTPATGNGKISGAIFEFSCSKCIKVERFFE